MIYLTGANGLVGSRLSMSLGDLKVTKISYRDDVPDVFKSHKESYLIHLGWSSNTRGKEKTNDVVNSKKEWSGYDIDKSKVVNLFDQGIVDPTKVTRLALENAVSVAGTMLITEAVVSIGKKKKQPEVNPAMMGM